MFSGLTPDAFRRTIEAAGLKITSSHATRLLTREELASGIPVLVMAMEQPKTSEKELKVMADYLNSVGEMCSKAGIKFGYHNHEAEFRKVGDTTMMDYLIGNTDPSKVFFELDVWWAVKAGVSPVDYMKKYRGLRQSAIYLRKASFVQ